MWDELTLPDKARMIKLAVDSGITNLRDIHEVYNKFQNGGEKKTWKALSNIDYQAVPDSTFTKDKTGVGDIEYFAAEHPEGVTYPNGYHRNHPVPGKDAILYNPKTNDEQDIRLDALHIMPKDPTYDVLNILYREAAKRGDVQYNAEQRYKADRDKYGAENIDSFEQYFNNEADGLLRNMLIEGTPEYIQSKRYYPDKKQLAEWNNHLVPYIEAIKNYLETAERPWFVLPAATVTAERKANGGHILGIGGDAPLIFNPWNTDTLTKLVMKLRRPKDYSDEVASTVECAKFSNQTLRNKGYNVYGDAWTRTNNAGTKIFSGYDGLTKPTEYDRKAAIQYVNDAAKNARKNLDLSTLQDNDIVGLSFYGSPNVEKAFLNGANGEAQTHTGHVKMVEGEPYIEHNVHGDIRLNKASDLLGAFRPVNIVSVFRPNPPKKK